MLLLKHHLVDLVRREKKRQTVRPACHAPLNL